MQKDIEKVLAEQVKPMLSMHGGDVKLVQVTEDGVVKVKLTGACAGCPSAQATLAGLVEEAIKSKVPQVKRVEAV